MGIIYSFYVLTTLESIVQETFEKHEEPGLDDDQFAYFLVELIEQKYWNGLEDFSENTLDLEDFATCNQKLTRAGCSEDFEIANESSEEHNIYEYRMSGKSGPN
ncbi:hypothetical protein L9F63_009671, partial [Diploptera punctata]